MSAIASYSFVHLACKTDWRRFPEAKMSLQYWSGIAYRAKCRSIRIGDITMSLV